MKKIGTLRKPVAGRYSIQDTEGNNYYVPVSLQCTEENTMFYECVGRQFTFTLDTNIARAEYDGYVTSLEISKEAI